MNLANPFIKYGIIAAAVIAILTLSFCVLTRDGGKSEQAEQGVRSNEALADAAASAVKTVTQGNDRERSIDQIVAQAEKEIDNAPSPAARRAATIAAVCSLPDYRDHPSCQVREPNP